MPKFHGYSMSIPHEFIDCRPWFTMVNICLQLGKHARLLDSMEHAKLYFIINTQTEINIPVPHAHAPMHLHIKIQTGVGVW